MINTIFYSQNREDLYIKSFFPDLDDGFYIDIGAFDPIYHSVTKLFYEEGWSGINVEPQKFYIDKLIKDRPKDTNLHVGVSDKKGEMELREYKGGGLSTFSKKIKDDYENDLKMKSLSHKDYTVEVITLNEVFEKVPKNKKVNFLKVDVEGLEYEVFSGNNWTKNRPELICVESNHMDKNWKEILLNANYSIVYFDGLNEYYLAEESSGRKSKFDFPALFLEGSEIVPYDLNRQISSLRKDLDKSYKKIETLDKEIAILHEETKGLYENKELIESKNNELNLRVEDLVKKQKNIRHNSRMIASSIKSKVK